MGDDAFHLIWRKFGQQRIARMMRRVLPMPVRAALAALVRWLIKADTR